MNMTLLDDLTLLVGEAFAAENIDPALGIVKVSDRPDLAQFQCNGALAAAKALKTNPRELAGKIAARLENHEAISDLTIAGPGFLNIKVTDAFLIGKLSEKVGGQSCVPSSDLTSALWSSQDKHTIILDYGGPNVAKPLHVGHLRAAIIGESLKRILRHVGAEVISDVHLGDWGLQMGQLISEVALRQPDLVYFDDNFDGPYPSESPVTLKDLEEMYPVASANCKADPARLAKARSATFALQDGHKGYRALWAHFIAVSRASIEQEYADLGVSFDLWKGEADADPLIPDMIKELTAKGLVEESDGAKIIRVARDDDNKKVPPIMLLTSEGSVGYHTTDIATILDRVNSYKPSQMLYVVDQRQALHFEQVFRAAEMAGYFEESNLEHLGFGTMNGKDGKPFKTREGGILKLRDMIDLVEGRAHERILESGMAKGYPPEEVNDIARKIGVAALKFADLSNARTSDYIFDLERFMAFEGKTGPYLLYASVRIRSVLKKANASQADKSSPIQITAPEERDLILCLLNAGEVVRSTYEKRMPHILCEHAFVLAQAFSKFYAACRVSDEADPAIRSSRIALLHQTGVQLDLVLDLLGIDVPERM